MIHAITRGKVSQALAHREDVVTSSVFGALRYVSHEIGLTPWLSLARRADGACLDARGPWTLRFWPALPDVGGTVEPDVLLEPTSRDAPTLLVECKLWSGPSGWPSPEEREPLHGQLGRQWHALQASLREEQQRGGHPTPREGRLVYITADITMPRETLAAMADEVARKRADPSLATSLYWLSWRSLAGALGAPRSDAEGTVLGDLRALLAHHGFDACRTVRPPTPVEIAWRFERGSTTR